MGKGTRAKFAVTAIVAVAALAGCGGGGRSTSASRPAPPPKRIPTPKSTPTPEPTRAVRPCGDGDLVVSHEGLAGGAMSTDYAHFTVFNLSKHTCSIQGFPKLLALGVDGRPIGGPAKHGTPAPEGPAGPVDIERAGSASFRVSWAADAFPAGKCGPRTVARYRVSLPGSHLAQTVPYPTFGRCASAVADETLSVGRLEPVPEGLGRAPEPPPLAEAKPAERLPRCAPADLLAWQGVAYPGGAAAGTSFGHLEVTNLSTRPCRLAGVPRMVAVDLRGHRVGPPVGRSGSMPTVDGRPPVRVARLGPHGSAIFTFSVGEVLDYGTHGCEYRYAAGFDVTLPGASRSQYVPAPVRRCLHSVAPNGPQVSVGPIE